MKKFLISIDSFACSSEQDILIFALSYMSYEFPFSSQNSKGTIVLTVSRATKGYYEGPVVSYPFAQPFRKFPVLWVQFDLKITNFIFCCQKHTII